ALPGEGRQPRPAAGNAAALLRRAGRDGRTGRGRLPGRVWARRPDRGHSQGTVCAAVCSVIGCARRFLQPLRGTMTAARKSKPSKPYWEMTTEELREATKEFDQEFIIDTFRELTPEERKHWEHVQRNLKLTDP